MDADIIPEVVANAYDSFSIRIVFDKDSRRPERIFASMAGLIKSMQELDSVLAHCVSATLRPEYAIEDIQTQSLRGNFKRFLENIDDEHLLNLDWKKIVGSFLVKGKHKVLKKLEANPELTEVERIAEIASEVDALAIESGVLKLPGYKAMSHQQLIQAIAQISESRAMLTVGDSVEYICEDDIINVNNIVVMTQEEYDESLSDVIHEGEHEEVLKIRKPDFIGNTSWGFMRHDKNAYLKVADKDWLRKFWDGEIALRPGDMMRVRILEGIRKNRRTGKLEVTELIHTVHRVYREIEKQRTLPIE